MKRLKILQKFVLRVDVANHDADVAQMNEKKINDLFNKLFFVIDAKNILIRNF